MSPAPGRLYEDVGVREAPLGKPDGDAADFWISQRIKNDASVEAAAAFF